MINEVETRYWDVLLSNPAADAMIRGGVILITCQKTKSASGTWETDTPANIASEC